MLQSEDSFADATSDLRKSQSIKEKKCRKKHDRKIVPSFFLLLCACVRDRVIGRIL